MAKNYASFTLSELYTELIYTQKDIQVLIVSLVACLNDKSANLTELIGKHARNMPKFNLIPELQTYYIEGIRTVCTGEMSLQDALVYFGKIKNDLDDTLSHIKM